jgi:hypothetical protein
MAIIEDIFEGNIGAGLAVGAGMLLLPVVMPLITGIARPLVKSVIKGGIVVYDAAGEYLAEAGEYMSDITAEARAELAAGGTATAAVARQAGERTEAHSKEQAEEGQEEASRPGGRKK